MALPNRRRVTRSATSAQAKAGGPPAAQAPVISVRSLKSVQQQKRMERLAMGATVMFAALVGFFAWYTDGRLFTVPWSVLMGLEAQKAPRDPAQNCQHPENAKTPYCIERKAKIEGDWQSISRHHRGKGNAFTLTEH
jgi:hypothetical protein